MGILLIWACSKSSDTANVDCSTISGATFTSNSGKMQAIISANCSGSSCHSAGGREAGRFLVSSSYATIQPYLSQGSSAAFSGTMPPGGGLSSSDLAVWKCWRNAGFPQ